LQEFKEQVIEWAGILGPNIYLKATVAIVGFTLAGKIAELILSKVLLRIVSRSSSKFDDELIRMLQRPVFITFVLTGLAAAARILDFTESALFITLGIIRTVAIFTWYGFLRAAFTTVLAAVSRSAGRSSSFASMLPLVETVARVVLLALAIYFVFLAWNVNVTAWLASAGIIGLAKAVAKELASRGITVNTVAPGYIETDMTAALADKAKEAMVSMIPLGRAGEPEDIAAAVVFLASDEASYITGQVLHVSGGMYM